MMMFAQYCRIESIAGGVMCSDIDFIRACHTLLNKSGKSRAKRGARHAWIKSGLAYKSDARKLYFEVMK